MKIADIKLPVKAPTSYGIFESTIARNTQIAITLDDADGGIVFVYTR